ncbi:MAG: hypothetical protein ACK5LX_02490 [Oscillospiraceae bacterium]
MKKTVIAIFLIFALLATFTACSPKDPITKDTFIQQMEADGYEMVDISDQYDSTVITSATIALKDDYQVEFYEFSKESDASAAFANQQAALEPMSGGASTFSSTAANYSKYQLTTSDTFYAASRVGSTMIYAEVPKEMKGDVNTRLEALGY